MTGIIVRPIIGRIGRIGRMTVVHHGGAMPRSSPPTGRVVMDHRGATNAMVPRGPLQELHCLVRLHLEGLLQLSAAKAQQEDEEHAALRVCSSSSCELRRIIYI